MFNYNEFEELRLATADGSYIQILITHNINLCSIDDW